MRPQRALLVAATLFAARPAPAQSADVTCVYSECALGLSPTLTGLDVVRGKSSARVASLNFFLPADVSSGFTGNDSAMMYARRAYSTRRTAAAFTDIGLTLFAAAGAKVAADRGVRRAGAAWLGAGAAFFAVSFPLQLRADGQLSSAVWWYNSRFHR